MRSNTARGGAAFFAALYIACASSAPQLAGVAELSFELTQNHIYLPVAIEDNAPSWFLVDTGAGSTVLAQSTAEALQLRGRGKSKAQGLGPAVIDTTLFRDIDLRFGDLSVALQRVPALPLQELSLLEGRLMEGVLGYDVLRRYVIEIDYERRRLRFQDPAHFVAQPQAVALPITFNHNHPVIQATITLPDGRAIPVRLMVDTGAGSALMINRPFAEKHRVYDIVSPGVEGSFAAGVGGATSQRIGRIKRLQIAEFAMENPVASLSRDARGAGSSGEVDGLIGGEVLRRFTLTIDYPHRRLLITPNRDFSERFEFDMGGLLLRAADTKFDRFLVRQVVPGSPAMAAGLEIGDELLAINGNATATMTITAIRRLFRQPDVTYTLRLRRNEHEFEKTITTRRLL